MTQATPSRGGKRLLLTAVAGAFAVCASQAHAITAVTLCAEAFTRTEAPVGVPMWGYRLVSNASQCDVPGAPTAPGPVISVPQGSDSSLAITLVNKLNVPTSIVLAAQNLPLGGAPVMATDVVDAPRSTVCTPDAGNRQTCRVRSFTNETAPGASRTYVFNNLRSGTYLYQTGTHPQVQVQMGLAGMAIVGNDTPAGVDEDVPVVLSEIDPAMHNSIASLLGTGDGTAWQAGKNSTLKYAPTYFMINGKVFGGVTGGTMSTPGTAATDLTASASYGSTVRLRIANAGLASRVLLLNSGTWKVVGEDGYDYPAARVQSSLLVPAGKTTDADITLRNPGNLLPLAIFDRRDGSEVADGGGRLGGQVARVLQQNPSTTPALDPIASQVVNAGDTFRLRILGTRIFGNSGFTFGVTGLPGATVGNDPNDSANYRWITWTAPSNGAAPEVYTPVTVTATNSTTSTTLSQSFGLKVNHAPAAPAAQVFVATGDGAAVTATGNGLGGNATDADGDALTAMLSGAGLPGLTLQPSGLFTWTGVPSGAAQNLSFAVKARDPYNLQSPTATTMTISVAALPPRLDSIAPAAGMQGTVQTVTLNGAYLAGVTAVNVAPAASGVVCALVPAATDATRTANCSISETAALGARTLSVSSPSGTSAAQTFTVTPPVAKFYFSISGNANVTAALNSGNWRDSDIYYYDGATGAFTRAIDTTTAGLNLPGGANVNGYASDGAGGFYMTFTGTTALPGVSATSRDVMRYANGAWTKFFDGVANNVGASVTSSSVVGGTLYFTLGSNTCPPGACPAGTPSGDDADIYRWNGGTSYTRMVDATAVGVPSSATVDGLKYISPTEFYMSFNGTVSLTGQSGGTSLSNVTRQSIVRYKNGSWSLYYDGAGLNGDNNRNIDAFDIP